MTKEDLQELADKIDFRILKDVQVPDMGEDTARTERKRYERKGRLSGV